MRLISPTRPSTSPTSGYVAQDVFQDGDFRIRIVFGHRLRLRLKRGVKPQVKTVIWTESIALTPFHDFSAATASAVFSARAAS